MREVGPPASDLVADRKDRGLPPSSGPVADSVTVLTFFLILLAAVPSRLVFSGVGSAGNPSTIIALGAALWWVWDLLQRPRSESLGRQPVRLAVFALLASTLASYAAGMLRAIPAAEVSTADVGILRMIAWTGVALVANDGIRDSARLETLLRRIVVIAGVVAILGLVQFATGEAFVDKISLPGMISTQDYAGVQSRGSFVRSIGTAIHPLEYSTILTMALPLALTRGLEPRGSLIARWWAAAAIAAAAAVAVSRSTILCVVVALAVMSLTWVPRIRFRMLAAAAAGGVAVFLFVPGMLGVLASLFTGLSNDSSAQSRSGSMDLVGVFFQRAPFFGRGFGTFLPEYRILDNQFLLTLLETGLVGLLALVGLIVTAIVCADAARRRSSPSASWAQALTASMAAGAMGFALFDGLAFPQAAGLFFVVAGASGAAWRIARSEDATSPSLPS